MTEVSSGSCEITGCTSKAFGFYVWGSVPQQQAHLCQHHAEELWAKSPPDVKDRMSIFPSRKQFIATSNP